MWCTEPPQADICCCPAGLWSGRRWWLRWWTRMQEPGREGWRGQNIPRQRWLCAPWLDSCPPSGYILVQGRQGKVRMWPACSKEPWRPAWPEGRRAASVVSSSWCSWTPPRCSTHSPSTDPASGRWGSWCSSTYSCSPSSWASEWPPWHRGHPAAPGQTPESECLRTAWLSPPRRDGVLEEDNSLAQAPVSWNQSRNENEGERDGFTAEAAPPDWWTDHWQWCWSCSAPPQDIPEVHSRSPSHFQEVLSSLDAANLQQTELFLPGGWISWAWRGGSSRGESWNREAMWMKEQLLSPHRLLGNRTNRSIPFCILKKKTVFFIWIRRPANL